ncbi:DMT family transporter [Oceanimonas baumannii]|uniref:EamA-like transporter family protein n=1 Tax=Oceanimonas baumannii TaxID=129578 RepID=A0A235C9Z0_9GAMM|nr:DMT family transporter [Oceanimonas baumannii]OYD21312.1 multidrug transporter [Oceanimonas baumannii]TDW55803.1 EamA-like transporter family protein [Oceanimonas baumannii]
MLWIPFTLFAAFMQAWRNAFQKQLSQHAGAAAVTLARFVLAWPLAGLYLWLLYHWQPAQTLPAFTATFAVLIVAAAVSQIVATALMVRLFQLRNYAVGVGLAKSEAVLAAALGVFFFSAPLTFLGWLGVIIGGIAVWLLSGLRRAAGQAVPASTLMTGLGSGLAFALTSLWVREASLELGMAFPFGAAWVLLLVISLQTLLMVGWLGLRNPQALVSLWQRPGLTVLISLTSCLGSIGWFTAMSLESVALVKTLGQVEVLFTLMISVWYFRERLSQRDHGGLVLIVIAAVCVMWA